MTTDVLAADDEKVYVAGASRNPFVKETLPPISADDVVLDTFRPYDVRRPIVGYIFVIAATLSQGLPDRPRPVSTNRC